MTTLGGKAWHRASVIRRMDASAQPLGAPPSARASQAIQAGPRAELIAQVLLLTALAATVGLNTRYARWR